MPTFDLKIRKVKSYNSVQKKFGFATRAIINGTESFASVAEEASRNTTLNKYELEAALGIAAEQFARALKNGFAIDLGPIGKIYPNVKSKWTETAEEQVKSDLKPGVRYDMSAEIKEAVAGCRLSWEKADGEEVVEEEVVEEETEEDTEPPAGGGSGQTPGGSGSTGGSGSNGTGGSGSTGSGSTGSGSGSTGTDPEKYTVAWYLPNGNPIIWYELAPGEPIPEAPQCPEGYYWHPYPSTMPNHDLDIIPEPIQG